MVASKKGAGEAFRFILANVTHEGDDCLIWPFARIPKGYGHLSYNGQMWRAHRLMCILANGESPTRDHHAAHTCGNGHGGCINPKHLEWKTPGENNSDRSGHGTGATTWVGPRGKLNPGQVMDIRRAEGITDAAMAQKFGVSEEAVRKARVGQTFRWV